MRIKILDIVIAVVAAGIVAASAAAAYGPGTGKPNVVIKGRDGEWVYPLSVDRSVEVSGPLGNTLVVINGGSVRIKDSPCPNKTCVAAGAIERNGQWVACLPNEVLIRVEGGHSDAGVDASVY